MAGAEQRAYASTGTPDMGAGFEGDHRGAGGGSERNGASRRLLLGRPGHARPFRAAFGTRAS